MVLMPQDLTKWDIRPKQGNGTLPMTIFVEGYLTPMAPYNSPIYEFDDNQTIILQIDWGGGDFHDTTLSMVTRPDSSTGTLYHGYFSGTVDLVAEGGNGIWIYAPGTSYFRVRYAGNSTLAAVTSPIITVISTSPAHAYIYGIRQKDESTGVWYSIYPEGQTGHCTAGATLTLTFGVQNNGSASGTLYCTVTRLDTGAQIINEQFALALNEQHEISVSITMPNSNLTLRFEIGHY